MQLVEDGCDFKLSELPYLFIEGVLRRAYFNLNFFEGSQIDYIQYLNSHYTMDRFIIFDTELTFYF